MKGAQDKIDQQKTQSTEIVKQVDVAKNEKQSQVLKRRLEAMKQERESKRNAGVGGAPASTPLPIQHGQESEALSESTQ